MQKVKYVWPEIKYCCQCPKCMGFCMVHRAEFRYSDNSETEKGAVVICKKCSAEFLMIQPDD